MESCNVSVIRLSSSSVGSVATFPREKYRSLQSYENKRNQCWVRSVIKTLEEKKSDTITYIRRTSRGHTQPASFTLAGGTYVVQGCCTDVLVAIIIVRTSSPARIDTRSPVGEYVL